MYVGDRSVVIRIRTPRRDVVRGTSEDKGGAGPYQLVKTGWGKCVLQRPL